MLRQVFETIRENRLVCQGDTVIAAVSGGADSVALLDILSSLTTLRLNLVVAHLNHGLRGKESDGDAVFVEELAARYRLPFELRRVDVKALGRQRKLSLEEAGRVARYEWFDVVAKTHAARLIALGHHADDQAETFLLRLFRGSGTTGLSSMRPLSSGRYLRPLLPLTRAEILAYLERHGLSFRHDSSNDETLFLRNRVRHECLPYLRKFNPAISDRLNNAAEILAADEEVLEKLIDQLFPRFARRDSTGVALDVQAVCEQLPGVRFRLYRRALLILKGDLARIATTHLKQIDHLVFSLKTQGEQSLPGGLTAMRCYDSLYFRLAEIKPGRGSWEVAIEGPGRYELPDGSTILVRLTEPPECWGAVPSFRAYFDQATVPFPWKLRTFQPGDRFQPLGMAGTRKVKDFFIDKKIPQFLRRRIPLLFCGEVLMWVCGQRVSESGRVQPGTHQVVEVEIPEFSQYSACNTADRMVFHQ